MVLRPDLEIISEWIAPDSRVLDLGCGDGSLLAYLHASRRVNGYGLEIDEDKILKCIESGVNVIQTDLDAGLSDFDADSFDYVVLSQTLQAVLYPERLLDEMLRVGREGIVSFPNFGYWPNRLQILWGGHMPVSRNLPNEWYNTPNIHLCTLKDFERLCAKKGITILQRTVVDQAHRTNWWMRLLPNLLGEIALYRFPRTPPPARC
ncbi:MAG: methionine biosynthesis protein MetW, partial [Gammaproteobacteria bacterium]|nr:methionine biosynthesis protein MetW [Gammaproteobacteria bacterium]